MRKLLIKIMCIINGHSWRILNHYQGDYPVHRVKVRCRRCGRVFLDY